MLFQLQGLFLVIPVNINMFWLILQIYMKWKDSWNHYSVISRLKWREALIKHTSYRSLVKTKDCDIWHYTDIAQALSDNIAQDTYW